MTRFYGLLLCLSLITVADSAIAQDRYYHIYIDTDNNTNTGCDVDLPDFTTAINGTEGRVTITTNSNQPPTITSTAYHSCDGLNFDNGISISPAALGLNSSMNGSDVFEAEIPQSILGLNSSTSVAFYYVTESDTASDIVLSGSNGGPITLGFAFAVPALGFFAVGLMLLGFLFLTQRNISKKLSLMLFFVGFSSVVWAMSIVVDGQTSDWNTINPENNDPINDTSVPGSFADLTQVYLTEQNDTIFFRMDVVDLENQAPLADDVSDTTLEDNSVIITVTGSDAENEPLTFSVDTPPTNGTLSAFTVVNDTTATVEYTPNADFNGNDTFSFVANDGQVNSGPGSADITVTDVNDEPTFNSGGDVNQLKTAGVYNQIWASNISAGAADEATQILNFSILSNDNAAIFTTQPSIDSAGVLTFEGVNNVSGTANLTVNLTDDGGTANGGDDSSVTETFAITLQGVNDEPTFTAGGDVVANEDAGAQTIAAWATNISPGPVDEAGQNLTFNLTVNDNPSLFIAGPSVDPITGDLTYTAAPDANGLSNISIELMDDGGTADGGDDTSPSASFNISVVAVNDMPTFVAGANQSVLEGAGAQTVNGWATGISPGPADEVTQNVTFNVSNDNNALFSVQPAIDPAGHLTYTTNPTGIGSATVSVSITDDGGTANGGVDTSAIQTFDISITLVNDEPSFTVGADQTVTEDAGPQSITAWATAISAGPPDEIGQMLTFNITANDNAALFSAGPAVAADGTLTYTPAADVNGVANITLELMDDGGTANGGDDTSPPQNFSITVTAVNDAPLFTAGANESLLEGAGAQTVNGWATGISPGPADEAAQTVSFNLTNDNNTLFAVQPTIDPTGNLTYTPAPTALGSATVSVELMDNGGTANGGVDTSATQTFTISITAVNDEPSFTVGAGQTILEDAGAQSVVAWATAISAGPPDEVGQVLTFNITANDNAALFSVGPAVAADGTLTYTPAADANGVANISLELMDDGGTANGGDDTSPTQNFSITVTTVNDAPSFTAGADQTILENSGSQTVNGWATAISVGPADEAGQTGSFNVTNNNNALFSAQPAIDAAGNLTYTSAANVSGSATVSVDLMDDGGTANGGLDTSVTQMFTITINFINDAPSFTVGADQTVAEDAGAQTVIGWATAISAGPPDEAGQVVTFNITGNTNAALFSAGPTVAANGDLTYTPAANANGSATITLTLMDDGGTANGGVDTSPAQSFNINVTAVNDPPTVTAPGPIPVTTNIRISVPDGASDLLANATDPEGTALTIQGTGTIATDQGGTVLVNNTSGEFTYDPPAGFIGADTFDYQVCDNGTPLPSACSPVTTVTLNVSGNTIWFIDNTAAAGGDGTLQTPFNSLAAFNASTNPAAGDFIYLATGTGTYAEAGITLANTQTLLGQGTTGAFDTITGITAAPLSIARPTLGGTRPIITSTGNGINLASGNTLRGIDVGNTTGFGVSGTVVGTLTVEELAINGTGGAISIDTSGDLSAANFDTINATTNPSQRGMFLRGLTGTLTFANPVTLNGNTLRVFDYTSSTADVSFTNTLQITATEGIAFSATSGGSISVTGNNSTINTEGLAVLINRVDIAATHVTFQTINSTANFDSNGIRLVNTGNLGGFRVTGVGNVAGSGGTISNRTGGNGSDIFGNGVFMSSTNDVELALMQFNDISNFAIKGENVTNFSLIDSVINGTNGDSAVDDEGAISFTNLSGVSILSGNSISGGIEDQIRIINTAGSLDLTINDSSNNQAVIGLDASPASFNGNDGLLLETSGNAIATVLVNGVEFTGARGDNINTNALGTSMQTVSITNNTFNNTHPNIVPGGGGVTLSGAGTGAGINIIYTVTGNTFNNANGNALTSNYVSGSGAVVGTIDGNMIGTMGASSGSVNGSGILVGTAQNIAHSSTVNNNTVANIDGFAGLDFAHDGNGVFNSNITNNDVSGLGGFAISAMSSTLAGGGTATGTACLDIENNSLDASGAASGLNAIFIDQLNGAASYNLPGFTGSPNGEFAVACAAGTASADGHGLLNGQGNTYINGAFPLFPAIMLDSSLVCGMTGVGTTCP